MYCSRFYGVLIFSSVVVVGAPTCAMSQARDAAQDLSAGMRDSWKTPGAESALFADQRVERSRSDVETADGTVTLRGKVHTAEAKAAGVFVAKAIDGVRSVGNDLPVVPAGDRLAFGISDEDVTRGVKDRLSGDGQLRKVVVRTESGVVILTGAVPSLAASARASERARGVAGVRSVKNELTYDAPIRNRSGRFGPRPDTGA